MAEVKEVSVESTERELTIDEKCGQLVDDLIGAEHPAELRKKLRVMWDRYALSESSVEQRQEIYEAYQVIDKALKAMRKFAM